MTINVRAATEEDIAVAMEGAPFDLPTTPAELLEVFNRVLDVLGVPDEDGDICERDEA